MSSARRVGLVLALLAAAPASAQSHQGSLGLLLTGGFEYVTGVAFNGFSDRGFRVPVEVGGTLGLFTHSELTLSGRVSPPIGPLTGVGLSFYGGLRNSFGYDLWRTFFDLQVAVHATPFFSIGGRAGFGVMYELLPIMGIYAEVFAQFGGGVALRISFDASIGVQFRTYLFDFGQ